MSTRRSLLFSVLDRYASLAIAVLSTAVIARLLTPTEVGIFSVVMVLLLFVSTVRDLGAGQYLLQERELTTDRIRAVWAVQLGLGLGLAVVVVIASYPVSLFYHEPRMLNIMLVVALNYAVNPFGSLTYAWLMREMRFESVALMRFSSALSGAIVGCWLAWKDVGPISLAFGSLTATVINALMAIHYRPKTFPWLPGTREIKRVLAFGSKLTASSVVTTLTNSAPELLIGKLQSLTAAGLYSRSNGLVQMFYRLFVDAVGAVCLPWFAKQSREHGSLVDPFLKATSYVSAMGWSFCLAVICLAHPLVRVLYGDQWDQSVDLARMLAVAMAFSVPASLCQTALLSLGAVSAMARVTAVCASQTIFFTAWGATHGIATVGLAVIASAAISAAIWLAQASKHIQVPGLILLRVLGQSAMVALLAGIGPFFVLWQYGAYPAAFLEPLTIGALSALTGFGLGVIVLDHPLKGEIVSAWSRILKSYKRL